MATFLSALDTSVVGTAMPTIIGSLGGLPLYSWVFSAYLLTSTTTVPVYGRLADVHGRKPVFVAGATLFLLGSALCGLATNMEQLILFRAIQGLGAGAVLPVSLTVVGDVYSLAERARIQGLLSGVWGVSSILGPAIGGLITEQLTWQWVFYVNLPVGIVAIGLFTLYLRENFTPRKHSIDYVGAAALTAGVTLLLLGLLGVGSQGAGLSVPPAPAIGLSLLVLGGFVWHETRVKEPMLPPSLFRSRVLTVSNGVGVMIGTVLFGVSSFIPPFIQGVQGGSALAAGAALAPMSLGWPVGSVLGGRAILRHGYRPILLLGTGLIAAGSALLIPLDAGTPRWYVMSAMAVVGLGMGFGATASLVAVQSAVAWESRGIATASVQFFRTIGGAVGVAAMGAMLNSRLQSGLENAGDPAMSGLDLSQRLSAAGDLLDPVARGTMATDLVAALSNVFSSALVGVYAAIALAGLVALAGALLFPRGSVDDHAHAEVAARESRRNR